MKLHVLAVFDLLEVTAGSKQLSALRSKAKYQEIHRRKHPVSDARLALDRDEWRAGKFHTFDDSTTGREDRPWHWVLLKRLRGSASFCLRETLTIAPGSATNRSPWRASMSITIAVTGTRRLRIGRA
jgi:hypothetical protein